MKFWKEMPLWRELTNLRKNTETKFTVFVKEWRQQREDAFLKDAEHAVEQNLLYNQLLIIFYIVSIFYTMRAN